MEDIASKVGTWQEVDKSLFNQLEPIYKAFAEKPTYSLLKRQKELLEKEETKFFEAFDSGEEYQPDLTPDFDLDKLSAHETKMLELRAQIKAFIPRSDEEIAVKNAYRWKINATIGDIRIAKAARNGDMRRFDTYNEYIYGQPTPELFSQEIGRILNDAQHLRDNPKVAQSATKVEEIYKSISSTPDSPSASPELFEALKKARAGHFAIAMAGVSLPERVTAEVGMPAVERILKNIGAKKGDFDYKVVETDITTASVNHSLQEVRYPSGAVYSPERFTGLYAGHEVGDHVLSTINGKNSGFRLMQLGLDRPEAAGEGRGVIGEQLAYKSLEKFQELERSKTIMLRHVAICLAKGLDGKPRNFNEVFKMIEPVYRMYSLAEGKSKSESKDRARHLTWNLLAARTMKGSARRGSAYLKDMIYAEGVYQYWKLADAHPETIPYWYQGKFDFNNPRHVHVLQALGVLPIFSDIEPEMEE